MSLFDFQRWFRNNCPAFLLVLSMGGCGGSKSASNQSNPIMEPQPRLGINLSAPVDWNTELPFSDVFHLSRAWISQKHGAGWGKGPTLSLDRDGWVTRLEKDCFAETPLCTIDGGHYPKGSYTVLWKGRGKLQLSKGKVLEESAGRMVVDIDPAGDGFFLRILETQEGDPVRNIRVLLPGVTPEEEAKNPWNPSFLARWKGVAVLRFMDFQHTNNSTLEKWSDRPRPEEATFSEKGIPVELLCDLANRLETDAWFCMPHLADDDFVRQFAKVVREKLNPGLKAWVEYSNEVWNHSFKQAHYAVKKGREAGLARDPNEAGWHFTGKRSAEIFQIFEDVFGTRSRLVRVLPAQVVNTRTAEGVLKGAAPEGGDVLAIAPYISMMIQPKGGKLEADTVAGWSVDRFLDEVEKTALPEAISWVGKNREVAAKFGLRLVAYEAGQHFVGISGAENNKALTDLLLAANAHPRMRGIYQRYYAGWEENGGDLLCHFSSVAKWTKWGSWGLLQHADDDPTLSPKFMATMEWGKGKGQKVGVPGGR